MSECKETKYKKYIARIIAQVAIAIVARELEEYRPRLCLILGCMDLSCAFHSNDHGTDVRVKLCLPMS